MEHVLSFRESTTTACAQSEPEDHDGHGMKLKKRVSRSAFRVSD